MKLYEGRKLLFFTVGSSPTEDETDDIKTLVGEGYKIMIRSLRGGLPDNPEKADFVSGEVTEKVAAKYGHLRYVKVDDGETTVHEPRKTGGGPVPVLDQLAAAGVDVSALPQSKADDGTGKPAKGAKGGAKGGKASAKGGTTGAQAGGEVTAPKPDASAPQSAPEGEAGAPGASGSSGGPAGAGWG